MRLFPARSTKLAAGALLVGLLTAALAVQAVWLFSADPARAETYEVHLNNAGFIVPTGLPGQEQCKNASIPCLVITEGDSIKFIWDEGTHSVTGDTPGLSDGKRYDSGVHSAPYEHTFEFPEDMIITFGSTVKGDEGLLLRVFVTFDEPTPPPTDTATSEPSSTPTTGPSGTPTTGPSATPTTEPTPGKAVELFEGWTPIQSWGGPTLLGDGITVYLNENVDPNTWDAAAHFNGSMWEQRFKAPPLPSFNTLNEIQPGDQVWIFALQDALLTY
jgi:hypothetical protein